jgi:hypothetical protein
MMRAILTSVVLGITLLVTASVPAQAAGPAMHGQNAFNGVHRGHLVVRRHIAPQAIYPFDYYGGDFGYEETASPNAAPTVIVTQPASGSAAPTVTAERDERATVETTPSGVTIVRGPGSRHIAQ